MVSSRWPALLAVLGLLAIGGALVLMGYLGTFNTRSCVPPSCSEGSCTSPPICWTTSNPWPGFLGIALWVAGLGVAIGVFLRQPLKLGRSKAPPKSTPLPEVPEEAAATAPAKKDEKGPAAEGKPPLQEMRE